ncbi:MAG: uridine diphosphate-N-acetylglucosamine-binding protein YvcK [Candidatus Woykebacteria bacterium]
MEKNDLKIVVVGGGTGTYTVLSGLKRFNKNLTAVVTMMDSGGSSGRLRDEFGILPPGDVRQSIVALSADTSVLRKLFNYRFEKGQGLEGHSFGNIFLTALSKVTGGMDKAIQETSKILNIRGRVLPVTTDHAHLVARYEDGNVVEGEGNIDEPKHDGKLKIEEISLEPSPAPYEETLEAIKDSNVIVLGPGDLFTSIIPNLLVPEVAKAICRSGAIKIYIVNLMTKYGQTYGFSAESHVSALEKYLGKGCLNFVFINKTSLPDDILKKYEEEHDFPVEDDLEDRGYKVVRTDLLAEGPIKKAKGDTLKRSLIRHDSKKLAESIMRIV